MDEEREYLTTELKRFIHDIPWVEPEKSSEKDSEEWDNHNHRNVDPSSHTMIPEIPIDVDEMERTESRKESCKRHDTDVDDIKMKEYSILFEVDEVSPDIETIRKEEEPEKEKNHMPFSLLTDVDQSKEIWDEGKDEIPDESHMIRISRESDSDHWEYSSEEAKNHEWTELEHIRKDEEK